MIIPDSHSLRYQQLSDIVCGLFFVEECVNEDFTEEGTIIVADTLAGRPNFDDILDYTVSLLKLQANHKAGRQAE